MPFESKRNCWVDGLGMRSKVICALALSVSAKEYKLDAVMDYMTVDLLALKWVKVMDKNSIVDRESNLVCDLVIHWAY